MTQQEKFGRAARLGSPAIVQTSVPERGGIFKCRAQLGFLLRWTEIAFLFFKKGFELEATLQKTS